MIKLGLPIALMVAASAFVALPSVQAQPIFFQSLAVTDSASTAPASPDPSPSHQFLIGPQFGVYIPTSTKTRNTYGDAWTSVGVGFGTANQATEKGAISGYFDILYNTHNDNRAFVLPFGISYRQALTAGSVGPYYDIQALAIAVDQRSVANNVHSGFKFGEGARAALGIDLTQYAYVEAGYLVTSTIKSFDFSGTELTVGLRF